MSYLTAPIKDKTFEQGEFGYMKYGACSMQGWRSHMEDAHIAKFNIAPDTHIFGVFDGHGGHEVAKYVSYHFIETLLNNEKFKMGNYSQALAETFLTMDEMLKTRQGKKEIAIIQTNETPSQMEVEDVKSHAGCTSCVALMVRDKIYVANAGDSRCYIVSKGQTIPLTEDHKPTDKEEKDRILSAGGEVVRGRVMGNLNLSRAIGDLDFKDNDNLMVHEQMIIAVPDVRVWNMTTDDEFLLLGCDGIWECLPSKQIYELINEKLIYGKGLKQAIADLLDNLVAPDPNGRYGYDNMTCLVLTLR